MDFTIEAFDYHKDIHRVSLMNLSPESSEEALQSPLMALGVSLSTVVLTSLVGSDEAYLFTTEDTGKVLAAFGVSSFLREGKRVRSPWFLSSGFERETPEASFRFARVSKLIVNHWFEETPELAFYNVCLNVPHITRWLTWLGFTVEESNGRFTKFFKKGGNPHVYTIRSCPDGSGEHGDHKGTDKSPKCSS